MSKFRLKNNFSLGDLEKFVDDLLDNPPLFFDLFNPGFAPPLSIKELPCLPDLPGIYLLAITHEKALEEISQIVYIGSSVVSIKKRFKEKHHKMQVFYLLEKLLLDAHKTHFVDFDNYGRFCLGIFCWPNPFIEPKFLRRFEELLIDKINPPCNYLKVGKNRDSEIEETFLSLDNF
ncbi:hypothetical protein H6G33_37285 [Calothrix sp. FACHB-1219]|nr:hypothetical protein [Calothrix sp. FACHB-1219]MBD2222582.1 hypothetical protein [Calothrix sp. FACHB-1219]